MTPRLLLAHLVSTGVGPFFDGAAHFFLSFSDVFPTLALAFWGGLRGPRAGRALVLFLLLGWIAGGSAGLLVPGGAPPPFATAALLLFPGVLLAWDRDLPVPAVAGIAGALGLILGFFSGQAMELAGPGVLGVLGSIVAAIILATLAAAAAASLPRGWPRIVLRVAGSWIAALGLLALGWSLRK